MVLIFSLSSHIRPSSSLNRERTKWHIPHLHGRGHSDRIIAIVIVVGGASGMGEATLIIATSIGSLPSSSLSEAQAAWVRPLRSSPSSPPLQSRRSLSLLWWLVVLIVGGWLILVDSGRLIGLWVWDLGWVWDFGWWCFFFCVGADIGYSVYLSFFFGSSGWYWWSVVDLWGWPVVVGYGRCGLSLQLLMIMGGIIYYFNV